MTQMVGPIQAQPEAQRQDAQRREEAQRLEAQILRTEALRRGELALAREQIMAKMKTDTEEANQRREQAL